MEFTFKDLSNKTVPQLRKVARELEDEVLKGYSKMPKEQLLAALCKALGVEDSAAPVPEVAEEAPAPEVVEEVAEEEAPAPRLPRRLQRKQHLLPRL